MEPCCPTATISQDVKTNLWPHTPSSWLMVTYHCMVGFLFSAIPVVCIKDFQMDLMKPWSLFTESTYSSALCPWDCWCVNLLPCPVRDILEFVIELCEVGKQYHTFKTLTLVHVPQWHTKSLHSSGAIANVSCSWNTKGVSSCPNDIDIVLLYIRRMATVISTTVSLSCKLAIQMALAYAGTYSNLALDLTYHAYKGNRVNLLLPSDKNKKYGHQLKPLLSSKLLG